MTCACVRLVPSAASRVPRPVLWEQQLLYRAAVEHLFQALAAPALASPEEARVVKLEIEMHLAQAEAVSFIMNGGFLKA